jgi:hypothetical protein
MSKSEPLHGDKVRAVGVARMQDNDRAVLVCFDRKPTDDELRDVHDTLAGRIVAPSAGVQTFAVDVPTLDEALVVLGEMYEVADTPQERRASRSRWRLPAWCAKRACQRTRINAVAGIPTCSPPCVRTSLPWTPL